MESKMKRVMDSSELPEEEPSNLLNITLHSYQKQGLYWLIYREKPQSYMGGSGGGILADEMGLGKTIQIIALILSSLPTNSPTLVICPPSLLQQWKEEIEMKTDSLTVYIYHGNHKNNNKAYLNNYNVVLSTYSTIIKSKIRKYSWYRIVLDEAHIIRNSKSKTAIKICEIPSKRRWCLTGM